MFVLKAKWSSHNGLDSRISIMVAERKVIVLDSTEVDAFHWAPCKTREPVKGRWEVGGVLTHAVQSPDSCWHIDTNTHRHAHIHTHRHTQSHAHTHTHTHTGSPPPQLRLGKKSRLSSVLMQYKLSSSFKFLFITIDKCSKCIVSYWSFSTVFKFKSMFFKRFIMAELNNQ